MAIVLVVAVIVRILMMSGSSGILWGDSDVFIETFGAIRNGRFFEHDPFRTLLYPYFLSAFLIWSGEPPMDQIFIGAQHVLGAISATAFFHLARRAFDVRTALAGHTRCDRDDTLAPPHHLFRDDPRHTPGPLHHGRR